MLQKINVNQFAENYNKCAGLIKDLGLKQLYHLFTINNVSYRTLLPGYLVNEGYMDFKNKKYNAVLENHKPVVVPVSVFQKFIDYSKQYSKDHKKRISLDDQIEVKIIKDVQADKTKIKSKNIFNKMSSDFKIEPPINQNELDKFNNKLKKIKLLKAIFKAFKDLNTQIELVEYFLDIEL